MTFFWSDEAANLTVAEMRAWMDDYAKKHCVGVYRLPKQCPVCCSPEIASGCDWTARSNDPQDLDNVANLDEYHCRNDACGVSFWL